MSKQIELMKTLNQKLNIFFDILHNITYSNCNFKDETTTQRNARKSESWKVLKNRISNSDLEIIGGGEGHGIGSFQQFLVQSYYTRSKDITWDDLHKWFNDTEHGFIHGIFCFFMYLWKCGYLIPENSNVENISSQNINLVDIFQSCLFHDFYRIYDVEYHDKKLKEVFPNLLIETYNHSNPNEDEINTPIVIGDRFELMRYRDHKEWIDNRFDIKFYSDNKEQLDIFYKTYRRYLEILWINKDENWMMHHPEEIKKWKHPVEVYPQISCYQNLYCVNVGSYDSLFSWHKIHGIIPIKNVKSNPIFMNREHPSLTHTYKNNTEDFVFFVKEGNVLNNKYDDSWDLMNFGINPVFETTLKKFIDNCKKIQSIIQINTFKRL